MHPYQFFSCHPELCEGSRFKISSWCVFVLYVVEFFINLNSFFKASLVLMVKEHLEELFMLNFFLLFIGLFFFGLSANGQTPPKRIVEAVIQETPEDFRVLRRILHRSVIINVAGVGHGSGVLLSVKNGVGLVLTAQHVVRNYDLGRLSLPVVDGIPYSEDLNRKNSTISLKEKAHFASLFDDNLNRSERRVLIPLFYPSVDFSSADKIIDHDFGLMLMGSRLSHRWSKDPGYTSAAFLDEALSGKDSVKYDALVEFNEPKVGEKIFIVGGLNEGRNEEKMLEGFHEMNKEKIMKNAGLFATEMYSRGTILNYEEAWLRLVKIDPSAEYRPDREFFIQGPVADLGMSGGGIFDTFGRLLGIVTHIVVEPTKTGSHIIFVQAHRIDYILESLRKTARDQIVQDWVSSLTVQKSCREIFN